MKVIGLIFTLFLAQSSWAIDDAVRTVGSDGGYFELHSFYPLLQRFDIDVKDSVSIRKIDWSQNKHLMSIKPVGSFELYAPYGGLKAVKGGQVQLNGEFTWVLADGKELKFKDLQIRPTEQPMAQGALTELELVNAHGVVVFTLNNIHAGFNQKQNLVFFENMDLRISPWLAKKINIPELTNHIVGQAHMYSNLVIPSNYQAKSFTNGACAPGDNYPPENPDVDVALIKIEEVEHLGDVDADHVIFTPSATLENVGTADVAWHRKFTGIFEPYENDQHPYLIWNMYREIDGRFEQIGASGVKHAFFTVNTSCSCSGGQVLFPTCQDKYSVGNNDLARELGPREKISSFDGLWNSTGSFFDKDANGVQDSPAPAGGSYGLGENRMVVNENLFADSSLPYYISSWYLIRDDVNIFNNMGYKQFEITSISNPTPDSWLITPLTNFTNGPASDQYVTPNSFDLNAGTASQRILQDGEGHLTVAVKVVDLNDGTYRYNYMIENHDYDPQIQTITLPLADSASMINFVFADTDEDVNNDWIISHVDDKLILQAPASNEIDWGYLYSFSFTTDSEPQSGPVTLTGLENGGSEFDTTVITPFFDDLIFENGFDILN